MSENATKREPPASTRAALVMSAVGFDWKAPC